MARTTVEKICEKCQKPYRVHPCRYSKSKYCSQACYNATKNPNVSLVCPQCNKQFTQWASKVDVCCSRKCADLMMVLPRFARDSKELLEFAREHLSYNPETGLLIWIKKQPGRKASIEIGTVVSFVRPDGYLQLTLRSRKILAHRVAWALYYGEWPKEQLDHINRIRYDNRIANLRKASHSQNLHNVKARNNTGICGIYERNGRFVVRLKRKHVGSFANIEEAIKARLQKAIEFGVEEFLPK